LFLATASSTRNGTMEKFITASSNRKFFITALAQKLLLRSLLVAFNDHFPLLSSAHSTSSASIALTRGKFAILICNFQFLTQYRGLSIAMFIHSWKIAISRHCIIKILSANRRARTHTTITRVKSEKSLPQFCCIYFERCIENFQIFIIFSANSRKLVFVGKSVHS
jgi:hypothetical protein